MAAGTPPPSQPAVAHGMTRTASPIPERHKPRKARRRFCGLNVLEGSVVVRGGQAGVEEESLVATEGSRAQPGDQHNYRRLAQARGAKRAVGEVDGEALLEKLPVGFAEDYFSAPAHSRLGTAAAAAASSAGPPQKGAPAGEGEAAQPPAQGPQSIVAEHGRAWLRMLQMGFSLLLQGVGSKWAVLETFADEVLLPWGAAVVRINGFSARLSLTECLRDVFEQLHPEADRLGNSVEALVASMKGARRAASTPVRPLCLVVHTLEALPPAQQESLARLVAVPGVHLVTSTDSVWAPLCWSSRCLRDFNFCREEVHTEASYDVEAAGKHPGGLPAWCNPNATKQQTQKASTGLVLRSLTNSHRELVQAMAQHQLEVGGRAGLSQSRLLTMATDRMFATNITKLRSLLNELRDHKVVAQRSAADGSALFHLPVDDRTLQRLGMGQLPEESEGEESEAEAAAAEAEL